MDRIDLLEIFTAIADLGSMAAVARARGQTPSRITASLKRLEDIAGVQLVQRSTRKLSLTPEGDLFLADCRRILQQIDSAFDRAAPHGSLRGRIRITTTNDLGRTRLPPIIDSFLASNPDIRIDLMLNDGVTDIVGSGIDLAIRTGPLKDSSLKSRLLLRGTRQVCAAPGYWDRHGRPSHPRDLAKHNCLIINRDGAPQSTWHFNDGDEHISVPVSGDRSANDGGAVREWAIAGGGVALKSSNDIQPDIQAGRLEAVLEEYSRGEVNIYAVTPGDARPARRVEAFIEHLAAALTH
ncbi:LysR family transcriptional regulator [Thioclava sp. GXIMD2076]|uniref:LysR family transcriptional regulator n=1 Tax=unclassified Thioclava TaxID=2621713 RepID=UPI0030D4A2C3